MTYIVLDNQKALKNSLRATTFTLKKIQALFKELHRNLRTYQGKMEFKDFSTTSPKIQGLLNCVNPERPTFFKRKFSWEIIFCKLKHFRGIKMLNHTQ